MPDKARLESKLEEISSITKNHFKGEKNVGVLDGLSGMAMFHFYYAKYLDDDSQAETGSRILEHAIALINSGYDVPTYCSGLAGFGWTLEHLRAQDFLDIDSDDLLEPMDDHLFEYMKLNFGTGYYDFLHGALGYAYYFLQRFKNTQNQELQDRYKHYLATCISELEKLSIREKNTLKWKSILDIEKKNEGYNLSLSHGMSSILGFLNRLYEYPEFRASTRPLIEGSFNYIRSFFKNDPRNLSQFPSSVEEEKPLFYSTRVAWCYGDLGIGLSLLKTAKLLKMPEAQKFALDILHHASRRKEPKNTMVVDAGICHGSFGNAQVFQSLGRSETKSFLEQATDFWMEDGLEKAVHSDGFAGYKQWYGQGERWEPRLSLLEGITGIGLVLLDQLSEQPNTWDECLLLN